MTGGHQDPNTKCTMKCKWCGSHEHNSTTHPKCPFWNAWCIITLLYNPYFVRNQMNPQGYLAWDGVLDPKWDIKSDLTIEKTFLNKDIYPQLMRQLDILKWLCCKNDVFFTMDEHIKFMDKIFNVFNGTKKEFFAAKKLNEKKQKYFLSKFLFRQDVDLDGEVVTRNRELCNKVKQKINQADIVSGNFSFFDYSNISQVDFVDPSKIS